MKKVFSFLCLVSCTCMSSAAVEEFNGVDVDIQLWAGNGSNESLLVLDWNDSQEPAYAVWGYRWDGNVTVRDMIDAIKLADTRLFEADGGWEGTGGESTVYGFGFDADSDGGSFVETAAGYDPDNEVGYATDADDHYAEGWCQAGFWVKWESTDGLNWTSPWTGVEEAVLSDGLWAGFSWDPVFSFSDAPTVPEPCTMALLGLGVLMVRRRKD